MGVPKAMGVKLSCKGAIEKFKASKFSSVPVPRQYHPVFEAEISPISKLVEFPIRVMKYLPSEEMKEVRTRNRKATYLFRRTDPASDKFGWAPQVWQRDVGDVVAVRAGGKELLPQHMEALCRFCQYKVSPVFQQWFEAAWFDSGEAKDWLSVLAALTKDQFATFWGELAKEKEWVNVKSPYDIEEEDAEDGEEVDGRGDGGSFHGMMMMLGISND